MFAVVRRGRCTLLQTWAMRSLNLAFPLRADDRWFAPLCTMFRPNPDRIPKASRCVPKTSQGILKVRAGKVMTWTTPPMLALSSLLVILSFQDIGEIL